MSPAPWWDARTKAFLVFYQPGRGQWHLALRPSFYYFLKYLLYPPVALTTRLPEHL